MKKLIILFFLVFAVNAAAQVFDEPIDSTTNYAFRLYAQSARVPFTILNEDKEKIDSLIYALIVWTDSTQFIMVVDTNVTTTPHLVLKISNYSTGTDTFTTTLTADTVDLIADTLILGQDIFWINAYGTVNANDVLSYSFTSDNNLIVTRPASGTSALIYSWRWIKRY